MKALLFALFFFSSPSFANPSIKSGVLDLEGWDGKSKVDLIGDWKFIPDFIDFNRFNELESNFDQLKDKLASDTAFFSTKPGFRGSLILKILIPPKFRSTEIAVNNILSFSPFEIYTIESGQSGPMDPKSIRGVVSASPDMEAFQSHSAWVDFPKNNSGIVYLVVTMSSAKGIATAFLSVNPYLAPSSDILLAVRNKRLENFFVVGMFLLGALYSFTLFLNRRDDKGSLWLGIFGVTMVVRYISTEDLIAYLMAKPSEINFRLNIIGRVYIQSISISAFISHLRYYLPTTLRTIGKVSWVFTLASVILLALPPIMSMVWTFTITIIFGAFFLLIAIFQVARAYLRKELQADYIILGTGILLAGYVYDLVAYRSDLGLPLLFHYFIIAFILIQNQSTGKKFARAFYFAEKSKNQLERMNKKLVEQERARTLFFQNTSHELRTPLNGIIGFVNLLLADHYGEVSKKAKTQLQKVHNLSESLMHQVNTILDLARTRKGELKLISNPIALNELVKETRILCEALSAKNSSITFEVTTSWSNEENPRYVNDSEKVMTIIRNLIGNSFKFTETKKPNHIRVKFELNEELRLTVSDQGIGIPPSLKDKAFEEFFQVEGGTRRGYEGTGLGLAMVQNIVTLMGGSIQLESEEGKGTTSTIRIPEQATTVTESNQQPVEVSPRPTILEPEELHSIVQDTVIEEPQVNSLQPFRALVIDDNDINCEVIKEILEANSYNVTTCNHGADGIKLIKETKPDLVLLDLMMPDVSGEDVLNEVKKHEDTNEIPIILITARASQEDRIHGLKLGADDYLAKPIISHEMVLRVTNTLSRMAFARAAAEKGILEEALAAAQTFRTRSNCKNSRYKIT